MEGGGKVGVSRREFLKLWGGFAAEGCGREGLREEEEVL